MCMYMCVYTHSTTPEYIAEYILNRAYGVLCRIIRLYE